MRVAKLIVPPSAVGAGYAAMTGEFTTDDVAAAVRSANDEVGLDPGERTGDGFARLVAERLIAKAVAAEKVAPLGPDAWRGPDTE